MTELTWAHCRLATCSRLLANGLQWDSNLWPESLESDTLTTGPLTPTNTVTSVHIYCCSVLAGKEVDIMRSLLYLYNCCGCRHCWRRSGCRLVTSSPTAVVSLPASMPGKCLQSSRSLSTASGSWRSSSRLHSSSTSVTYLLSTTTCTPVSLARSSATVKKTVSTCG